MWDSPADCPSHSKTTATVSHFIIHRLSFGGVASDAQPTKWAWLGSTYYALRNDQNIKARSINTTLWECVEACLA